MCNGIKIAASVTGLKLGLAYYGLTHDKLAGALKVSRPYVSQVLSGHSSVSRHQLRRFRRALRQIVERRARLDQALEPHGEQ